MHETMHISRPFENIAFISSMTEESDIARKKLARLYGSVPPEKADVIVALGRGRSDASDTAQPYEQLHSNLWYELWFDRLPDERIS